MTDLPELFQAELDAAELAALFDDLAALAEIIEVRAKDGARAHAREQTLDLHEARDLVERRAVRGVQIRYRHAGELWMDTLMPGPTKVRLVRMKVPPRGMG